MPTLEWIGKNKVVNHHQEVPFRVLERQYSFDEQGQHTENNGSENMIIHGDNLEALKALLPQYEGKVKCIYIDPPYNTGNEGWCYNDNVSDPHIQKWLGEVVGKEGEDLTRHDKWLCMMYPRLMLLQKLLADDGVIFISIDDKEPEWNPNKLPRTAEMDAKYKNPDNDRTLWRTDNAFAPGAATHQGMVYAIQHPFTGKMLYPSNGACWRYQQDTMLEIMNGWTKYELQDLHKDKLITEKQKKEGLNTDSLPIHSPNPLPSDEDEAAAPPPERTENRKEAAYQIYRDLILENIEYDTLTQNPRIDREQLDEIVDILLETVCTNRKSIRVAGDDYPAELVKAKFLKLGSHHIEFVMDCLRDNTTKVRNIKQYLRAMLFNAPSTINSYYASLVAHDMAQPDWGRQTNT